MLEGTARRGPGGPITGEGFREWSDRMRSVEELLDNPELRAEAPRRMRDRVQGARAEFERHSKVPDWNQLQDLVFEPMNELRDRIAEEVPAANRPMPWSPSSATLCRAIRRGHAAGIMSDWGSGQ